MGTKVKVVVKVQGTTIPVCLDVVHFARIMTGKKPELYNERH